MEQDRILRVIPKFFMVLAGLFLGACTSSGVVPKDMNLAIATVSITQADNVEANAQFMHDLREEVRYEFSRVRQGDTSARLTLELRELAFSDVNFLGGLKDNSRMVSFGRLENLANGGQIGEFTVKVAVANHGADMNSSEVQGTTRQKLLRMSAKATLEKVYGKTRAGKIARNFPHYSREAYVEKVAGPIQLLRNPALIDANFSTGNDNQNPLIIEAPQLPVNAPQTPPPMASETQTNVSKKDKEPAPLVETQPNDAPLAKTEQQTNQAAVVTKTTNVLKKIPKSDLPPAPKIVPTKKPETKASD